MSTDGRVRDTVSILFLWVLALAGAGVAVHSFGLVPSDYPLSLTVSLMGLGGVLYLLSSGFVTYYGGAEFRLF